MPAHKGIAWSQCLRCKARVEPNQSTKILARIALGGVGCVTFYKVKSHSPVSDSCVTSSKLTALASKMWETGEHIIA